MFNPVLSPEERALKEAAILACESNADLTPLILRFVQQAARHCVSQELTQSAETGKQELQQICKRAFDHVEGANLKRVHEQDT